MKVEWTNNDSLTASQTTKAILVIDMPKSCKDCKLTYLDTGDDAYYGKHIRRCIFDDGEADANERYYDCPLKPMPLKMKVDYDTISSAEVTDKVVAIGWNACIEALENN